MFIGSRSLLAQGTIIAVNELEEGIRLGLDFGKLASVAATGARVVPVVLQDERLSTAAVTRGMIDDYDMSRAKRAERVDAAAAAWSLESALARLR